MIKKSALLLIKIYKLFISPFLGDRCRFYPSCSLYAELSIKRHGIFCGCWLILRRLLKCHPWHRGESYDPVPEAVNFFARNSKKHEFL
jgi:putative membrane protein insertion efficiency factor